MPFLPGHHDSLQCIPFLSYTSFYSISFHMMIILEELNIQQSVWFLWWSWKQKTPKQTKKTVEGTSLGTSWRDFGLPPHGGSCNTAWWCWILSWECRTQDEPESVCRQRRSFAGRMQERPRRMPGGELAELSLAWGRWDADRHLLVGPVLLHSALWALAASIKAGTAKRLLSSTREPTGNLGFHPFIVLLPSPGKWEKSTKNSFPAQILITKKCCPALSLIHVPAVMGMGCTRLLGQAGAASLASCSISLHKN